MLVAIKKRIIEAVGVAGLDWFEFYGHDVDAVSVNMAKIQMTLTDYRYMSRKK